MLCILHYIMILSTQSFTLFETIALNILFWIGVFLVVLFLIWYLKDIKDDDVGKCNPYDRT